MLTQQSITKELHYREELRFRITERMNRTLDLMNKKFSFKKIGEPIHDFFFDRNQKLPKYELNRTPEG